jgi:hypothetical protein
VGEDFDHACKFGPEGHFGSICVPEGGMDDFIGDARLDFSAQELEAALPKVGDKSHGDRGAEPLRQ